MSYLSGAASCSSTTGDRGLHIEHAFCCPQLEPSLSSEPFKSLQFFSKQPAQAGLSWCQLQRAISAQSSGLGQETQTRGILCVTNGFQI